MAGFKAAESGKKPAPPGLDHKSMIKGLGLCSFGVGSGAGVVDVRNGRIIRIRPLHFDTSYSQEEIGAWQITARGKTFGPGYKSALSPLALCYKKRVYSPNRLLYPLKRIDWDPSGERNPQNRGASEFARISWDEALDLIVSEINRIKETYGTHAILLRGTAMAKQKSCMVPMDVRGGCWICWVAIRSKPAIQIVGKAGIGAPNTCGEWRNGAGLCGPRPIVSEMSLKIVT